eukprot:CAMPEP_0172196874 /NCGR_PEP_ID=MMETSP1050-20130122/27088_1 /TAXON_ID=233186 /ORGANISM="Cryptomonas curvata, Strain CCAP979/52" /LENGTH=140 /DNA_ID=CAMNT_0012873261 /DNA_START=154 /DNA_END=576 /DNA_ORIENTATION=-
MNCSAQTGDDGKLLRAASLHSQLAAVHVKIKYDDIAISKFNTRFLDELWSVAKTSGARIVPNIAFARGRDPSCSTGSQNVIHASGNTDGHSACASSHSRFPDMPSFCYGTLAQRNTPSTIGCILHADQPIGSTSRQPSPW